MMTAYRTKEFNEDDRAKADKGVNGFCLFCKNPVSATQTGRFWIFHCGCKGERKYLKST